MYHFYECYSVSLGSDVYVYHNNAAVVCLLLKRSIVQSKHGRPHLKTQLLSYIRVPAATELHGPIILNKYVCMYV